MSKNKVIWVLEDDQDIGDVIRLFLEEEGYQVEVFQTIQSLEQSMQANQADLFVMDVMLPDGNGLDVCENIKRNRFLKDTPVIMMSASARYSQIAKTCSANAFIPKPFDINNFLDKVNNLVLSN